MQNECGGDDAMEQPSLCALGVIYECDEAPGRLAMPATQEAQPGLGAELRSSREILLKVMKVRSPDAVLREAIDAAAKEVSAELQDLHAHPAYRQASEQLSSEARDNTDEWKPLILPQPPRFRGQVVYSASAAAAAWAPSAAAGAWARARAAALCCIDSTTLRLVGGKEQDQHLVTLPLRCLEVQVDADQPRSFSFKVKSRLSPNAFLHAPTQEARNRWLCVLAKGGVPITLQQTGKHALVCPRDLPGFDDDIEGQKPGRAQRLVVWI